MLIRGVVAAGCRTTFWTKDYNGFRGVSSGTLSDLYGSGQFCIMYKVFMVHSFVLFHWQRFHIHGFLCNHPAPWAQHLPRIWVALELVIPFRYTPYTHTDTHTFTHTENKAMYTELCGQAWWHCVDDRWPGQVKPCQSRSVLWDKLDTFASSFSNNLLIRNCDRGVLRFGRKPWNQLITIAGGHYQSMSTVVVVLGWKLSDFTPNPQQFFGTTHTRVWKGYVQQTDLCILVSTYHWLYFFQSYISQFQCFLPSSISEESQIYAAAIIMTAP